MTQWVTGISTIGRCERCAHCGRALHDSLSVEIGVGPVCRKEYDVDPSPGDLDAAATPVSDYPDAMALLDDVDATSVPQRRRAVDGLTRLMSLNRENHKFFAAACSAIDRLGFLKVSAIMRTHIAAWEIFQRAEDPNVYIESTRWALREWLLVPILTRDFQATVTRFGRQTHFAVRASARSRYGSAGPSSSGHPLRPPASDAPGRQGMGSRRVPNRAHLSRQRA
jgi:hypothetical protein